MRKCGDMGMGMGMGMRHWGDGRDVAGASQYHSIHTYIHTVQHYFHLHSTAGSFLELVQRAGVECLLTNTTGGLVGLVYIDTDSDGWRRGAG